MIVALEISRRKIDPISFRRLELIRCILRMSISTRVSISWPPSIAPMENTNTLVLSFPSLHFIDLRPLKSSPFLDWGMAGYQINTPTPHGTKSTYPIDVTDVAKFVHVVDSRVPGDPLSVQDEGLFNKLANGDDLEIGSMMNPDTGVTMAYEEVWRDVPVEGSGVVLLESIGEKDKTFVGRVGKLFQGIGTKDGKVCAARYQLYGDKWEKVYGIGDEDMIPVFQEDEWMEGDEVKIAGRVWKVVDCQL
jgi:hypothetical protein